MSRNPQSSDLKNSKDSARNKSKTVSVSLLNARSLKTVNSNCNKLVQLQNIASVDDDDIFAITETWLNSNVLDTEILTDELTDEYIIYRRDREHSDASRGGGILLAVKKTLKSSLINIDKLSEVLAVSVASSQNYNILFIVCYRSPSSDIQLFVNNLNVLLSTVHKKFHKICMLGDFNCPSIQWDKDHYFSACCNECLFADLCTDFGFKQVNHNPSTLSGNILDLVLTNFESIDGVQIKDCDFSSDHFVLNFNISCEITHVKAERRTVYNFKNADFNEIKTKLVNADLYSVVSNSSSVNEAWTNWLQTVQNIIDECVPKIVLNDTHKVPWFDGEIRNLRNKKKTAWRRGKKGNKASSWLKFRKLRNKLGHLLKKKYRQFINDLEPNIKSNPKRFWSFIKSKTGSGSIPTKVTWNTQTGDTPYDQANLFNRYFHSVFTKSDDNLGKTFNSNFQNFSPPGFSNLEFSDDEVLKILLGLDTNKAIGPDKLSPYFLKSFAVEINSSLCYIFRMSFDSGIIPNDWLRANVIPIHKSSNKENVENYRPVSLLSIVSKICERIIHNKIYPYIFSQLSNKQHGFIKGRSTCSQMLNFVHEIGNSLDNSGQTDTIYLDFSKAFDTVSHSYLLQKLKLFGLSDGLLKWFHSYLSNRFQRVVVNGGTSDWLPVHSGVPQGSILGPLLFCIFIDDMPRVIRSSNLLLYADDTKCYKNINSIGDCFDLQADLDLLLEWSCKWNMKFNAKKCKVFTVTRQNNPVNFHYNLNGQVLERVTNIRDLGIILDSDLTWSTHVTSIVKKANQMSYLVKRSVGHSAPIPVKKQLYLSLVRSNVEYCSQVWGGISKQENVMLEKVQRTATKYILGYPSDKNYNARLGELDMIPLSYRREINDLVFFYKCHNHVCDVNVSEYVRFTHNNAHSTRSTVDISQLCVPKCHTEAGKRLYFNRIVALWNCLPHNVRNAKSVAIFRKEIVNIYKMYLSTKFDCDNTCTWTIYCHCPLCRFY